MKVIQFYLTPEVIGNKCVINSLPVFGSLSNKLSMYALFVKPKALLSSYWVHLHLQPQLFFLVSNESYGKNKTSLLWYYGIDFPQWFFISIYYLCLSICQSLTLSVCQSLTSTNICRWGNIRPPEHYNSQKKSVIWVWLDIWKFWKYYLKANIKGKFWGVDLEKPTHQHLPNRRVQYFNAIFNDDWEKSYCRVTKI